MIPVIHAHPDPDSFTAAIAGSATEVLSAAGVSTHSVDLYRCDGGYAFPPILDIDELRRKTSLNPIVQTQMTLVEESAGYVIVHPDWWGGPPAILKGWIDRVLRPGTAYEVPDGFGPRTPSALLSGKRALVIVNGDSETPGPLTEFWIDRVWRFCGVEAELLYLSGTGESSLTERQASVSEAMRKIRYTFLD